MSQSPSRHPTPTLSPSLTSSSKQPCPSEIEFKLYFGCDAPAYFQQGVKLEIRIGDDKPLILLYITSNEDSPGTFQLATYTTHLLNKMEVVTIREYICGRHVSSEGEIMLKWTQQCGKDCTGGNNWYLDDINIRYWDGVCYRTVMSENFSGLTDYNVTGGSVSTVPCDTDVGNNVLYFDRANETRSLELVLEYPNTLDCGVSSAVTNTSLTTPVTCPAIQPDTPTNVTSIDCSLGKVTCQCGQAKMIGDNYTCNSEDKVTCDSLMSADPDIEVAILQKISSDRKLLNIMDAEPLTAIGLLVNLAMDIEVDCLLVVTYLLDNTLNRFNSTDSEKRLLFSKMFLEVTNILNIRLGSNDDSNQEQSGDDRGAAASSYLKALDRLAFEVLPEVGTISFGDITVQAQLVSPTTEETYVTTSSTMDSDIPVMSIQIPSQLIGQFSNGDVDDTVRTVSFLYQNVESLFPPGLPGVNNSELGSGVVSTALQCGTGSCPTSMLELSEPVLITIQHSEEVQMKLMSNESFVVDCVFWEFLEGSGQWSSRGCQGFSNSSVTVCECSHLTHFAILLSASPPSLDERIVLSLEVIGIVGVSISLIAMVLTVTSFIIFKSYNNMRDFIHMNLCISLGIAQLIFVIGISRSGSRSDEIPIHCQAIAVLLHYFFLVSFMWMLMEGAVLYILLVKVFVTHARRYLLTFTLTSYGFPLVYMGLLTIPLGFSLPTQLDNYGYETACFLNPDTMFIWAFIAPAIIVILLNIVFLIIAATIMWRHTKRQTGVMSRVQIRSWVRALVSLTIVMGLTWMFGVLVVEVEELVPFAYIFTIMVAFQGVWIFLIFIVFPKEMRDAYAKLWRTKVKKTTDAFSRYFSDRSTSSTIEMQKSRSASRNNHTTTS